MPRPAQLEPGSAVERPLAFRLTWRARIVDNEGVGTPAKTPDSQPKHYDTTVAVVRWRFLFAGVPADGDRPLFERNPCDEITNLVHDRSRGPHARRSDDR